MKISELLTDKTKWTQGAYARDGLGRICDPLSPEAVCWCLDGAMLRCLKDGQYLNVEELLQAKLNGDITEWNDQVEWEDVEQLIKENHL